MPVAKIKTSASAAAKKTTKKTAAKELSLSEKIKQEIEKSLILDDEDKRYWLENRDKLPKRLVENFHDYLKSNNDRVDSYIKQAIDKRPELINELKNKISKINQAISEMQSTEDKSGAEDFLSEQLKQI